nr:MAG TPA: minor capsid protein [Caudoviricetes sp.]
MSHNFQKHYDPEQAVKNAKIQQQQRYYERSIRHLKRKKELAERDDDPESVRKLNQGIRGYQAKLRQIVKDNDFLARQYSREQIII